MPSSAPRQPATALVPVLLLMAAMVSIQGGAALAKHLFPAVGAQGTAALRLALSALLLLAYFRPWRVRMAPSAWPLVVAYGLSLGGRFCMDRAGRRGPAAADAAWRRCAQPGPGRHAVCAGGGAGLGAVHRAGPPGGRARGNTGARHRRHRGGACRPALRAGAG